MVYQKHVQRLRKKDTYRVGDVIALCNNDTKVSEDFYVISDNGSTVTALAKYNLYINDIIIFNADGEVESTTPISKTIESYGLQNSSAKGIVITEDSFEPQIVGTDIFQKNDNKLYRTYWTDTNSNLLSKYGSSYPADVFDSNSNLYEPLKNYENYIRNTLKKTSVSATLLSYNQAVNLGCNKDTSSCSSAPVWLHSTSYWTITANNSSSIYSIMANGEFNDTSFYVDSSFGLRPVITIAKSEL